VRVTLIHNPGAGKQAKRSADDLLHLMRASGHEPSYQSSKDDDWAQALEDPGELVVVAGGDGTVGRIAKRMAGRGVPMAVLPSGTANNISRSLGLVDRPFEELVRAWPQARRVKLDVGVAEGPWGMHYFVEGLGVGLFAHLLSSGSGGAVKRSKAKAPAAKVDNALERLKRKAETTKPIAIKASLDGKDISGKYILLEAVNIPNIGPNLYIAPDSKPGDGQLDVVLVAETERERLVQYLATWQENRERLAVLPSHQGKRLTMEWTGFEVHIDDELWPAEDEKPPEPPAHIEARIESANVEFLVPATNGKEKAR
jgi:diacylglycerol kinase (ATP)